MTAEASITAGIGAGNIVDFDTGKGESAAVKLDAFSQSIRQAKPARLIEALAGAPLRRKDGGPVRGDLYRAEE